MIYLWAPNEEAARAAAYRAFEKNRFEVLKDYLENTSEKWFVQYHQNAAELFVYSSKVKKLLKFLFIEKLFKL